MPRIDYSASGPHRRSGPVVATLRRPEGRCGRSGGFTLVELLIVVLIITILISMLGLVFPKLQGELKITKCQKNLRAIHSILQTYAGANDGWYPPFDHYYGNKISGIYSWDDGRVPKVSIWKAMSHLAQLKDMGASPDVFFCPFHPHYGDYDYWQIKSWEEPLDLHNTWSHNHYGRADFGYYFLINRGEQYGASLADGRPCIRKDSAGDANLPIAADILHYRNEGFKSGWWHGGGPDDGGVFNSSCNTLFLGGYVVYKKWQELNEQRNGQGYGTSSGSGDQWWFWLGHESEKY